METEQKIQKQRHWCYNPWQCAGWIILGVIGFTAFLVLAGFAIMWLWNTILPKLFGVGMISFWQAVGLAILARLLFGFPHKKWHHKNRGNWKYAHKYYSHHRYDPCCDESYGHTHHNGDDKDQCDCRSIKWQYYDQFWEEEGEKLFNDYVKRKMDKSE